MSGLLSNYRYHSWVARRWAGPGSCPHSKGLWEPEREHPRRTELGGCTVVGGRFVAAVTEVGVNLGSAMGSKVLAMFPPFLSLSFPQETPWICVLSSRP